jgi:Chaperone of endosialidase/YadA head domain repeat (2 copies)
MKIIFTFLLIFFCLRSFTQNIGIGTAVPVARLHIADSNVVFTGPLNVPVATSFNPPVQGAGTRMMWYPQKAAFRVGYVDGTQWDKDSIGNFSFASGYKTKAKGIASTAMGENAIALGRAAVALGEYAMAKGDYSTAFGYYAYANGPYSTAIGFATAAMGNSTIAMGGGSSAYGDYAITLGYGNEASGNYSTSTGLTTRAKGFASSAAGMGTTAKNSSSFVVGRYNDTTAVASLFEVGNGTTETTRSNAMVVSSNGYVWIQGYLTQTSDAKLKKNILPLSNALPSIQQINGYSYDWKDENRGNEKQMGVLAQELQKIYPQLVTRQGNGELSVNYIGLIPVLIEGMKEQQRQIEELKQAVQKLSVK